jgi:mono/diheme cytochrome c family protein
MVQRPATAAFLIALFSLVACDDAKGPAKASASSAPSPSNPSPPIEAPALGFSVEGQTVRTLRRDQLEAAIPVETLRVFDPYYGRIKSFRALPLEAVLTAGFAGRGLDLRAQHFVLRAKDGYTVPLDGERLLEDGGYLAIEDTEVAGWEPVGRERANPGPYYLIWKHPPQHDIERYPRPWQLATIEIAAFDRVFPRVVPTGVAPDSPARRGFAIFREHCIRCHAINQQGGQIGPELNVPQNILAYRPEDQVRAYIRNPETFRYSKMPAFRELSEGELDDLVAYLRAMGERQTLSGGAR